MGSRKLKENIFWVGAVDWDRRVFDSLIPLPDGTSYNAYLIKGTDKTALVDTVDPSMVSILMSHLKDVDSIDFIISNHAEQDHSGAIPHILERYKDARVITTPKGKGLLAEHLHLDNERIITVNDRETLSLGDKTLEFIHTPWVHWPETMVTYLREDRILFSCDLFGSHLAVSDLFYHEEWKVCEAAKRYYAEVMMPFRTTIRKHIEKIKEYKIDMIAPSHGPIHKCPDCIIQSHAEWVSDSVSNKVVLPYVSMHGSTQLMVDYLTESLSLNGITVERFNLVTTDIGKLAMALVDAATIVIGTPTVLIGAHPLAVYASFLSNALRPKLRFASIIGSFGWGGKAAEQITGLLSDLKLEILKPVIVKGKPKYEGYRELDRLASEIANKHKEQGIS
ncbi:MAG: MBL fold hydrolase [Deltaproteobacteria bacterium GWC2_42_11]|nr:MAG: MBL fold hydrolase [Deltaproteobacteria bacterium GWC2_42_11]HBO84520.1 MBL fold hydrolase [Deltaproteobacteria bacterium]